MLGLSLFAQPAVAQPAVAQPGLEASTSRSDTGEYRLSWTVDADAEVVLEEATSEDFSGARVLYEGIDAATVVSGRLDGTYHYRLRLKTDGNWSAPVAVEVVHHSAAEAFGFLALGGLVFLATAVLIISGHRAHRREMGAT